ncbi:nitrite reductase small subunit NirD [Zavarzinia sp.]|uniref:nitrite reductase small subunit NirD n=1 Tax=Zavarzinia sp. TaxID=2027920 RepID=UPI003BB496C1
MNAMLPTWIDVCAVADIPLRGARVVKAPDGDIAVFRTTGDHVFALYDRCPHKGGPLSQGIVHDSGVTCPLHNWVIDLETGRARGADEGCARKVAVELIEGRVRLRIGSALS